MKRSGGGAVSRLWAAVAAAAMATGCMGGCERREAKAEPPAPGVEVAAARQDGGSKVEEVAAAKPDAGAPVAAVEPVRARGVGLAHEDARQTDHLTRARELQGVGDEKGALVEARRAVFDDPENPSYLEAAARLARATGDRALAEDSYRVLALVTPGDALPLIRLTRLLLNEGAAEEAKAAASEAVLRDEGLAEAFHLRGRANLQLGKLKGAIADFEQAVSLDPEHAWALNNLGYSYLLAGEAEKAVEPLEKAAFLMPSAALVLNNLGIAYEHSSRQADATEAYARAVALDPKYVKANVNHERASRYAAAAPRTASDASPAVEADPDADDATIPVPPEILPTPADNAAVNSGKEPGDEVSGVDAQDDEPDLDPSGQALGKAEPEEPGDSEAATH